jgi:hypothetical protein
MTKTCISASRDGADCRGCVARPSRCCGTLLLVDHASDLHPSDVHFVDPAAVPAIATTAQMVADVHAHTIL